MRVEYTPEFEEWWGIMRDWLKACSRPARDKPGAFKLWDRMKLAPHSGGIKQSTQALATAYIQHSHGGGPFQPQPKDPVRFLRARDWEVDPALDKAPPGPGLDKADSREAFIAECPRAARQAGFHRRKPMIPAWRVSSKASMVWHDSNGQATPDTVLDALERPVPSPKEKARG